MSTDEQHDEAVIAALSDGVLCYLHLWAKLFKHMKLAHADIARDIGLWDDEQGAYFAAHTQGNRRMLQVNSSYVCAIGDDGPMVGQLDKVPPCQPVILSSDTLMLLNALAQTGAADTEKAVKQIEMIAKMIAANLPMRGLKPKSRLIN